MCQKSEDVEEKLIFPFRFEYSYETDEYKCYSKHFSDEIVEDEFAYFIVENYERTFSKVKEVLKGCEWKHLLATVYFLVLVLWFNKIIKYEWVCIF